MVRTTGTGAVTGDTNKVSFESGTVRRAPAEVGSAGKDDTSSEESSV